MYVFDYTVGLFLISKIIYTVRANRTMQCTIVFLLTFSDFIKVLLLTQADKFKQYTY